VGARTRFGLAADSPLIATGGSMGGYAALRYTAASSLAVTACLANCPVCDLPYHYTERPDLPRTFHHAFGSYGDIQRPLIACSPLHQAAGLPDVPYLIIHGEEDQAVGKAAHSDKLTARMRERNLRLEYVEVPGMGHCGPLSDELIARIDRFVISQLK
jgi:dipeptidyl aminopeptidase/acylaminoacyl peptidase